ncbi:MAG: efflux RND transporter periplasmic adaptor subunit [Psychrobium sp.]
MYVQLKSALVIASLLLVGCQESETTTERNENIRGLKTLTISESSNVMYRHYPSVLRASERSTLSFEIGGKLGKNNLSVGQHVAKGQVLLALDKTTLQLNVDQAAAALEQSKASLANTEADLQRRMNLFEKKIVTQAVIDQVKTSVLVAKSQVKQLEKQLETAQEQLTKSALVAPYDGIITSAKNNSYITVQAGEPIATIYNPNSFEAKISVSYEVVQALSAGKPVMVKSADNPEIVLHGHVSELASSTETVSTYPVIVHLTKTVPELKVGMAVEVSLSFEITKEDGFVVPLTAVITESPIVSGTVTADAYVYVYQADTQTVAKQAVKIGGIKENNMIITDGLTRGDIVAIAGVPFLTPGQKVKLLANK